MQDFLNNPGGRSFERGYPGMWADTADSTAISAQNENAGVIDFGVAVAAGADSTKCKPVTANSERIVGFSVRNASIAPYDPTTGEVGYAQNKMVAIGKAGRMLVTAAENSAVGDGVLALVAGGGTLGSTTGGAASASRIAIPGAKWAETVVAGNVGLIEFQLLGA